MLNRKFPLSLVLVSLFVTGCASTRTGSKAPDGPAPIAANDPAIIELNESALRVARASEQAALAISVGGKGKTPAATQEFKIDYSRLPAELRDPILLEGGFHGELEPFIRSLTDVMKWQVVVVGNKPSTPILVSLSEQRRPPAEWLADAGYQVGSQADVVLNPSIRQAVIKYR